MENKAVMQRHKAERSAFAKRRSAAGLKDQAQLDTARSKYYEAKAEFQTARYARRRALDDWAARYDALVAQHDQELQSDEVKE